MKEKLESLMHDMERMAKRRKQSAQTPNISDNLKGLYEGQAMAFRHCSRWLKEIMEGRE